MQDKRVEEYKRNNELKFMKVIDTIGSVLVYIMLSGIAIGISMIIVAVLIHIFKSLFM